MGSVKSPRVAVTTGGVTHQEAPVSDSQDIPYGYCHCGCGERTRIATATSRRDGQIKGEPLRYLPFHWQRQTVSPRVRFWEKVRKGNPDDCWEWQAARNGSGYGQFAIETKRPKTGWRKNSLAHRAAYELEVGPIPDGFHIDHLCRNRLCVNPAHLEAVPQRVNSRRAFFDSFADMCCPECRDRIRKELS